MKPRMFIMLFICHAVPLFICMGLFPLLPLYAARFGATRTDIGVFYEVVYIASTAGVLGTGWLAAIWVIQPVVGLLGLRDPRIVRAPARPSGSAQPIRLGHSFTLLLVASLLAFAATSIGRLGSSLSMQALGFAP